MSDEQIDRLAIALLLDGKISRYLLPDALTLTPEQIRNLPTSPVEILPPPGKGFRYRWVPDADGNLELIPVDEKEESP